MSTLALAGGRAAPDQSLSARLSPTARALLASLPLALALCWPKIVDVWQTGQFYDTDDAMRAVQVRDWMAGQGWFDLSVHRMGLPPGSLLSHWSRVVDVPLAGLIRGFSLLLPPVEAERAARIAFPLALQVAMAAAMTYPARLLAGPGAAVPAALLIVLGGIGAYQFVPGRIDHHAPQILLLTLMTGTTLESLDPARSRRAAATGLLVAVSLAISLENLPFVAVLLAVPPLAWVAAGARMRGAMLALAAGLGTATPLLFLATVAPARYGTAAADAFSVLHLAGALLGALALALLAAMPRGRGTAARAAAALLAGALALGAVAALFPDALHGPYRDIAPALRTYWLDRVQEAMPLPQLSRERPDAALPVVAPLLVCLLALPFALAATRGPAAPCGLARARWCVVLALVGVGLAGAFWQVRVLSSLQPLALLGGAWALARACEAAGRDGRARALLPPLGLAAAMSSLAWGLVPLPAARGGDGDAPSCTGAAALAPLAALPPGLAFAPIDAGSYLLAHTRLSALAGAYHRDADGNLAVVRGFLAPPERARAIVEGAGARYLLVCRDQTALEAADAPDGLAAALAGGRVPGWLKPVALDGPTPIRVYAVE